MRGIDAYVCDNGYRQRDPRYVGQAKHRATPDALWDKSERSARRTLFTPADFHLAEDHSRYVCPAGKRLYASGRDCVGYPLRAQCLRTPE